MVEPNFTWKIVLITGAGSGIGRATAIKLSHLRAILLLVDVNMPSIVETRSHCFNPEIHKMYHVDVSSSEQCNSCVDMIKHQLHRIDHVFNCAGINPTAMALTDVTDEYWDRLMNTNLKGTFNMTRACIPLMASGSSFVNVSSVCGIVPVSQYAVYCATKYGIIGFSKCMALELGRKEIRTNVVAPGYIDTPTNSVVVEGKEAVQRMEGNVALQRLGVPDEVATVVIFLLSDAARYVNGSVVEINGGMAH